MLLAGCGEAPAGLAETRAGSGPKVEWDLRARPLPELPLPNDIATRSDPKSPTGLRLNASLLGATDFETALREKVDQLSGWGTTQPIMISFDEPIDITSILEGHRDYLQGPTDYNFDNDVIFLVDVTPGSPTFGEPVPLDFGDGTFPELMRRADLYLEHDPKSATTVLGSETWDEDRNGNGKLDPGEDIDMDGRLDKPNLYPLLDGDPDVNAYDDVINFYDAQSHTISARPVIPLRPKTTYGVYVTSRLRGEDGQPVRSPFPYINHAEQTETLERGLPTLSEYGVAVDDLAFAWSFTTQAVHDDLVSIRDGMYGAGPLAWIDEDFPAEIDELYYFRDEVDPLGNPIPLRYIAPGDEVSRLVGPLAQQLFNTNNISAIIKSHKYPAYHVSGSFLSPSFMDLQSQDPRLNGVWPMDLADPDLRSQVNVSRVYFWCVVPRDEYKKDANMPAPVIVNGHGYGLNRLDGLGGFVSTYSQFGLAGCMIEAYDHGIEFPASSEDLLGLLLYAQGMEIALDLFKYGRGRDIDFDGAIDSGDTWFGVDAARTRDSFRQTLVDYMMLIRVLRGFDGKRRMGWDVDGDGEKDLAGDFNGDGKVDIGGPDTPFLASGVSLGGIMSSQLPAVEPTIVASVPVSGGGALSNLVLKSEQGGVFESFGLQGLGPAWVGAYFHDPKNPNNPHEGKYVLYQLVVNGNDDERYVVAEIPPPEAGTIVRVVNLTAGEARCGRVIGEGDLPQAELDKLAGTQNLRNPNYYQDIIGTFRVGLPAQDLDKVQVEFYQDDQQVIVDPQTLECVPRGGAKLVGEIIRTFDNSFTYRGNEYNPEDELVSIEHGLGLKRANPILRKVMAVAGTLIEPADPANFAPYYSQYALTFREGDKTFQRKPVNVYSVITAGDPAVPISSGLHIARSAGFFTSENGEPHDYLFQPHPNYDKTINRIFIDGWVTESITWLKRFGDAYECQLLDVDNHSDSANTADPNSKDLSNDGWDCPRLTDKNGDITPLRLTVKTFNGGDGVSGTSIPVLEQNGQHVFIVGTHSKANIWDSATYMANQVGYYLGTYGKEIAYDPCLETFGACEFTKVPLGTFADPCDVDADCYSGECGDKGQCTHSLYGNAP